MRSVHRDSKVLFVLALLLFSSGFAVSRADAVSTSSTTSTSTTTSSTTTQAVQTSLALSVVPPQLPADGGSYPAVVVALVGAGGKASLALNDTSVFLTSSEENVGSVSGEVTIVAGTGYAVADFTTSTTPGTTSISASAVGLVAASTQLSTVTPSGFPTQLKVIPVPSAQLVNPSAQGTVLVETLDSVGLPAKASSDIAVTLSSSNDNVLSLPATSLIIPSGGILASAPYDTSVIPGTSTVTASASGFDSGSGTVTVKGPLPFELKIFAEPDPIMTSATGRLVVTVTDQQGYPARAPAPITVTINSSNNSIVASQQTVTIGGGQIYAVASFATGPTQGRANLTASSPGLETDFAVVTVEKPSEPAELKIMTSPNPVLPDRGAYDSVLVELTNATGGPATANSVTQVTLTSSTSPVGSVSSSVTINTGSSYAVASFNSTFYIGSTTITASAQNLLSATAVISSYGTIPLEVVAQALPETLPADGGNYTALDVVLEDASGSPAIAPADIPVHLASSNTGIASVNTTVMIRAGETYALTYVVTSISPGSANITASASGYSSSSTRVTTTSPAPSQLALYVAPGTGIQSLGSGNNTLLAVQLQDSKSLPARARQDMSVIVTSSNSSMVAKPLVLSIGAGDDYAYTYIKSLGPGTSVLTASTSGLVSSSATLSVLPLPITVTLTPSPLEVAPGETATVTLQVDVLGSPLSGVNVTFAATSGAVEPARGVTDASGVFTGTFVPAQVGVSTVTATLQDLLLGNQTAGTNIFISHNAGNSLPTTGGVGLVGSILPVVLVVVVIVIIVMGARRVVNSRRLGPDEKGEKVPEV